MTYPNMVRVFLLSALCFTVQAMLVNAAGISLSLGRAKQGNLSDAAAAVNNKWSHPSRAEQLFSGHPTTLLPLFNAEFSVSR